MIRSFLALVLFATPLATRGQFGYQINNNEITITGYSGSDYQIIIPATISGYPVVAIGNNAFYDKTFIQSVVFPASLASIGGGAFFECNSLFTVTIPAGVTNVGNGAFRACAFMTNITVDPLNQQYSSSDGVLFDKTLTRLIQFPGGKAGPYITPDTVTSIGDAAFYAVNALDEAIIGGGVTNMGTGLFYQSNIKKVKFSEGVTRIPFQAFTYSTLLTNVSIPDSVTEIESIAFQSCSSLRSLRIPANVTYIAYDAFAYCVTMQALLFMGAAPPSGFDFSGDTSLVIYYLPGTTGWDSFFATRPVSPWNPLFQSARAVSGEFRAEITGATNIPVLVEASSALTGAVWQPFFNGAVTNGSITIKDPFSTNYPNHFYRVRWPWP